MGERYEDVFPAAEKARAARMTRTPEPAPQDNAEIVERVAKAIYESYGFVKPWDHPGTIQVHHRHTKTAALAAIRALATPIQGEI